MAITPSAPWHNASFDRFLDTRLPDLLADRLPLASYAVERTGGATCQLTIALAAGTGTIELRCEIPQPTAHGLFTLNGIPRVVVPVASCEDLEAAEFRCVGEQLHGFVAERLGDAPDGLAWDPSIARAWLPLDAWAADFLATHSQVLDDTNWLSRWTHLRRILIPNRTSTVSASELGRTCPFETPEGPNIARVLSIALGAEIRDGRLVVVDDRPEGALGLSVSMVPFLEHSDANRLLMGVNMMRQQLVPPDPEPALVQTGNEPDAPGVWCGRNLLTAFIPWGPGTYEDAIVLSQSCARRLDFPEPVEPGDKLANRHGSKGTVGCILPDHQMPHLPDGTPVELVYNFIGCHTRLNFGQIREAIMGRIARAEGEPAIVAPFHAPGSDELRTRLRQAGLPESGMETLTRGPGAPPLERPSTVGYVYWAKLHHRAAPKLHAWDTGRGQRHGEMEYYALRDLGAFETLAETHNTRSCERIGSADIAAQVAAGPIGQAPPPTPAFAQLVRRLRAAGIRADLREGTLAFSLEAPDEPALRLARPVPHPWLHGHTLAAVGILADCPAYAPLAEANARLQRMLDDRAPGSLLEKAATQLQAAAAEYLDAVVPPEHLRLGNRIHFSGRAVLSPALDLRLHQVGLADDLAWRLFGPLLQRELGSADAVEARSESAAEALDALMERSWVLVNRAPTLMPTSFIAFRPVRIPDRVVRLHPLACMFLNADFDGDQIAVILPITQAGQHEAEHLLSVAAHLRRDPELLKWLIPSQDILFGLTCLGMKPGGLDALSELAGTPVSAPEGILTKADLLAAVRTLLERDGVDATLAALERLMHRGFREAAASGASISPFFGHGVDLPPLPDSDDLDAWMAHTEDVADALAARTDFANPHVGPQLLAVKTAARGHLRQLVHLIGSMGVVIDAADRPTTPIRNGLSQHPTPREVFACVYGARKGLGRTVLECARTGYRIREASATRGFSALARAMRATRPGTVLARAAAAGEVDPLADLDARLFVGLAP